MKLTPMVYKYGIHLLVNRGPDIAVFDIVVIATEHGDRELLSVYNDQLPMVPKIKTVLISVIWRRI